MMTWEAKARVFDALMTVGFAAIGFAVPWPEVVAGLLLAIAGGFAGMVVSPPAERLGVWLTLGLAVFVGLIVGMLHPHLPIVGNWPAAAVMGGAGVSSRPLLKGLATSEWTFPWSRRDTDA